MTKATWTDDRLEITKRLWKQGRTAQEIAAQLGAGITRNAVIGKLTRLGLSRGDNKIIKKSKKRVDPAPPLIPAAGMQDDNEAPSPTKKSLLEMRSGLCYWPIGDPKKPDFHFCGGACLEPDDLYCAHHAAIAYVPFRRKLGGLDGIDDGPTRPDVLEEMPAAD